MVDPGYASIWSGRSDLEECGILHVLQFKAGWVDFFLLLLQREKFIHKCISISCSNHAGCDTCSELAACVDPCAGEPNLRGDGTQVVVRVFLWSTWEGVHADVCVSVCRFHQRL